MANAYEDFIKRAQNTAQGNEKYAGINFTLQDLGKQGTALERQAQAQQAGFGRALTDMASAEAQTAQENLREAQARGMTGTTGVAQAAQQTEAQRQASVGSLAQEFQDQATVIQQGQEDLLRDYSLAIQDPTFLANLVSDYYKDEGEFKSNPGVSAGGGVAGGLTGGLIGSKGGPIGIAIGAIGGALAGAFGLGGKRGKLSAEQEAQVKEGLQTIYGDSYTDQTFDNFIKAYKKNSY